MSYHVANGLKAAAIAAIAALGLSATAPAASADVVLKYSPWLPDGYPLNDAVLRPWIKEVERITEGRVKVDWLPKAVGSAKAQFDAVHDGLADMSLILPGYTPGRFELLELGELPLLSSSTAVVGPTFYDIYAKHLEPLEPFKGTHVISLWATIPTKIVVNTGIVKSVDDLSGLKLRAPSATAVAAMKALGAVPIQKSVSEMYELASTGIIDGTFFPVSTTYNFKVDGFLKYTTMVPGGMGQSVMVLLVNQDKWDAISEDDRAAIMAISGPVMAKAAGDLWEADEGAAIERTRTERPDDIADASPELTAAITAALQPIFDDWFARAKAKGLADPAGVLAEFRAAMAAAEKTN